MIPNAPDVEERLAERRQSLLLSNLSASMLTTPLRLSRVPRDTDARSSERVHPFCHVRSLAALAHLHQSNGEGQVTRARRHGRRELRPLLHLVLCPTLDLRPLPQRSQRPQLNHPARFQCTNRSGSAIQPLVSAVPERQLLALLVWVSQHIRWPSASAIRASKDVHLDR